MWVHGGRGGGEEEGEREDENIKGHDQSSNISLGSGNWFSCNP